MPFNAFATHRPSHKAYHGRNAIPWLAMASDSRRVPDECALPPLDIGVWAIQLSPYRAGVAGPYHTRLLILPALPTCCCSLALSGPGKSFASESLALNSGLLWGQFTPCVTRRTVSAHTALHPWLCSRSLLFNGQHSRDLIFGMEPKDCLPSPQRLAFGRVTTSYTLADPDGSGC